MKKVLILVIAAIVTLPLFAQDDSANSSSKPKRQAYVKASDFNHWSIAVGGGINFMYGEGASKYINGATIKDRVAGAYNFIKSSSYWAVKAEVEYMMNPVWGINLQYMYDPMNKTNLNNIHYTTDRNLAMHEALFQFLINPLNIARRCRTFSEWNMYLGLGLGAAYFQRGAASNYEYRPMASIPASMAVEYSPIPELGIFIDAQFRWYFWDGVNGRIEGPQNDMSLYGGLGLRYHIVTKNHKGHVRTIDLNTYEPLKGGVTKVINNNLEVEGLQAQIDELTRQLNQMSNASQAVSTAAVEAHVSDDVINQKVNAAVQNATAGLRSDVKSLDSRVGSLENGGFNTADEATIYFDINSAVVSKQYQLILAKIARRMQNNNSQKIIVRGYCDYRGDDTINKELAQKRIDAVVYILVDRYRIDRSRIAMECIGKVEGEEQFDLLNRRCDIIFK